MTTEIPPAPSPDAPGGAQIIPFPRPGAPDVAPPRTPEPDVPRPDDDGPSAA